MHYTIEKPYKKYIIFTQSYSPDWRLGTEKPLEGYPVNVFEYKDSLNLEFVRFMVVLLGYAISLVTLCFLVWTLVR